MSDTIKPSLHGWHDAGDYGKYTTNGAFTVGMMLTAFEHFQPTLSTLPLQIPEKGGAFPDFLDEVKWQLDWLLTTQGHRRLGVVQGHRPELRAVVHARGGRGAALLHRRQHAATADFAAALAQASRVYRPTTRALAATTEAARLSTTYLTANRAEQARPDDVRDGRLRRERADSDNRLWAAAELWETTGEAEFLTDFEARDGCGAVRGQLRLGQRRQHGDVHLLLSAAPGRDQTKVDL